MGGGWCEEVGRMWLLGRCDDDFVVWGVCVECGIYVCFVLDECVVMYKLSM